MGEHRVPGVGEEEQVIGDQGGAPAQRRHRQARLARSHAGHDRHRAALDGDRGGVQTLVTAQQRGGAERGVGEHARKGRGIGIRRGVAEAGTIGAEVKDAHLAGVEQHVASLTAEAQHAPVAGRQGAAGLPRPAEPSADLGLGAGDDRHPGRPRVPTAHWRQTGPGPSALHAQPVHGVRWRAGHLRGSRVGHPASPPERATVGLRPRPTRGHRAGHAPRGARQ